MTEERQTNIFNVRTDIENNKRQGYRIQPLTYLGKPAVRIICKKLKVDFLIEPIALSDLKLKWYASKLSRFISFYDWLLKSETN